MVELKKRGTILAALFILIAAAPLWSSGGQERLPELRIGMMPAVNSIPLIIAEENGYFDDEGISVELIMFKSQFYRESGLQSGEIDGSISDLINAVNAWRNGFHVRVTSATEGRFALVAAPESGLTSLAEWAKRGPGTVKTGLLENSIVYYVTERMLESQGVETAPLNLISTLHLPSRIEMVMAGELDAGCVPEPMTRLILAGGAHLLAETTVMDETPGVLLFTPAAVETKGASLRAFYRAYNRAVRDLQGELGQYRTVIVERGEFPPAVKETMELPDYAPAHMPGRELYRDVAEWMAEKGLVDQAPSYDDLMDSSFLP